MKIAALILLAATLTPTPSMTRGWRWIPEWTRTPARTSAPDPNHTPYNGPAPGTMTPKPTANWVEIDTAYTPSRGFTPRVTALPGVAPLLTPFVAGMSYAKRDHYAAPWWTPGAAPTGYSYNAIAVTAGTATFTRVNTQAPTSTRTRTPTPSPCIGLGGFPCTSTPTRTGSPTRTPTPGGPGRFTVTVDWATANSSGRGSIVPLAQDPGSNTAGVYFFTAGNFDLMIKVLDGCGTNSHWWVFVGGLTNVQVTITVVDNVTGARKVYTNPLNTPFPPVQDTAAFPCGVPA